MTILVCGSRDWTNGSVIEAYLRAMGKAAGLSTDAGTMRLIHGDCRGADRLAGEIAGRLGFDVMGMPADWYQYSSKAGPIRNTAMVKMNPDLVVAFHGTPYTRMKTPGSGTRDCLKKAIAAKIPTHLINEQGEATVLYPPEASV